MAQARTWRSEREKDAITERAEFFAVAGLARTYSWFTSYKSGVANPQALMPETRNL
jgi:hypothetical protein